MFSISDIRVMKASIAWVVLWAALTFFISAVTGHSEVKTDAVAFSFFMGLFVGAIVGVFGSTEPRASQNQNAFIVGAIIFGSLLPILLPGQTPRMQWAYSMVAVGVGALVAFSLARIGVGLTKSARSKESRGDEHE